MSSPSLASRVKSLRTQAGGSPNELSLLAGLSRTMLGLVEQGKKPHPSSVTITKLARLFGTDEGWLLSGIGDAPTPEQVRAAVAAARAAQARSTSSPAAA